MRFLLMFLPFIFCAGGFFTALVLEGPTRCITPSVIGDTIEQAIVRLSPLHLALRVVAIKQDASLEQGTIITQSPAAGAHIKEYQTVNVAIVMPPPPIVIAQYLRHHKDTVNVDAGKQSIQLISYTIAHPAPKQTCIGQSPAALSTMRPHDSLLVYYAAPCTGHIVIPQYVGADIQDVCDHMRMHHITCHVYDAQGNILTHNPTGTIYAQRPLAGTIYKKDILGQLRFEFQVS